MSIPVFPETKVALKGRKGLIVGIANDQSIAWGCAKAFRALIQISDRQVRPERAERLGATPGDRLIVGDADNQALASLKCNLGFRKYRDIHGTLSLVLSDEHRFHSSESVCCAIINSSSVGTT